MRVVWLVLGLTLLAGSRVPLAKAKAARDKWPKLFDAPFAPTPSAAPFLSLGYRELVADLLWMRLLGYVGGDDDTADNTADLADAIAATDPQFRHAYDWGARAILIADHGVTVASVRRALALTELGMQRFPTWWAPVRLAGDIYLQDVVPATDEEKRRNDEKGAELLERSARMPDAPVGLASTVSAEVFTRLGQRDRAIARLQEMILAAPNEKESDRLIKKLAELQQSDVQDLAQDLLLQRRAFDQAWLTARSSAPATLFILLGETRNPYLRLREVGARDTLASQARMSLPPLADDAIGELP